ncbi:MAG: hypothetical protein PWP71_2147 [Clostridia bacterium]|jgi:hypothetical protein|nr:hypothetical protein [Clostridia bacterium]
MEEKIVRKNGVDIDLTKVRRIIMRIILEERNNVKTKECSDSQMVDKLQKIIEEEAKCL